jgi:hypothetical protein
MVRMRPRPDDDLLPDFNESQIALGDVGHHPDDLMIDNPEQHVARSCTHAVDCSPLHNLAVLRRRPTRIDRDFAGPLYVGNERIRRTQVLQAPARPFQDLTAYAASERALRAERYSAAALDRLGP